MSPDGWIGTILVELDRANVRHVLTGSVAAACYGVPVEPRDLDIAPDLDPENLSRLAELLRRWGAKPVHHPDWSESLTVEECERWTPDPPTPENLDHLMTTPHGLVDVVPFRSGTYRDLSPRALPLDVDGRTIQVAHPADLVATLRPHKRKHQTRRSYLDAILERMEAGERVVPRWRANCPDPE